MGTPIASCHLPTASTPSPDATDTSSNIPSTLKKKASPSPGGNAPDRVALLHNALRQVQQREESQRHQRKSRKFSEHGLSQSAARGRIQRRSDIPPSLFLAGIAAAWDKPRSTLVGSLLCAL